MTTLNTVSSFTSVIAAGLVAVAVVIATSLGVNELSNFRTLRAQQIRNEAIDSCAHNSKYIYTEKVGDITKITEEPSQNAYAECLKLKSVK